MTSFFGFPSVVEWLKAILVWILPLYKILGVPLGFAIVCGGCRGATIGGLTANPQHEFRAKFSPLSRTLDVDYFSNDGQELHIKNVKIVKGQDGQGEFTAEGIDVTDKSVQNREANVKQMEQDTQRFQMFFQTLNNVVDKLAPGINSRLTPIPSAGQAIGAGIGKGLESRIGGVPASQPTP